MIHRIIVNIPFLLGDKKYLLTEKSLLLLFFFSFPFFIQEIYETPQVSLKPSIDLMCNPSYWSTAPPPPPPSTDALPSPGAATANKPRMRWTPELHERFVGAVNQLDGAESK